MLGIQRTQNRPNSQGDRPAEEVNAGEVNAGLVTAVASILIGTTLTVTSFLGSTPSFGAGFGAERAADPAPGCASCQAAPVHLKPAVSTPGHAKPSKRIPSQVEPSALVPEPAARDACERMTGPCATMPLPCGASTQPS